MRVLVGENDGIRFVQYVRQPEDDFMNFNNVAKRVEIYIII